MSDFLLIIFLWIISAVQQHVTVITVDALHDLLGYRWQTEIAITELNESGYDRHKLVAFELDKLHLSAQHTGGLTFRHFICSKEGKIHTDKLYMFGNCKWHTTTY